jgi:membrane protease YdiL (CAAX protease family)
MHWQRACAGSRWKRRRRIHVPVRSVARASRSGGTILDTPDIAATEPIERPAPGEHHGHPRLWEYGALVAVGFVGWVLCSPVLPIPADKHLRAIAIALAETVIVVGLGCLAARSLDFAPTATRRRLSGGNAGLRAVMLAGIVAGLVSIAGTELAGAIVVKLLWSPVAAAGHASAKAQAGKHVLELLKTHPLAIGVGFPLIEELHLRLFIMTALAWLAAKLMRGSTVWWTAIVLQAIAFGAMHALSGESPLWWEPRLVQALLDPRIVAGMVLGYAYWRWGLESSFIAHASSNAAVLALTLLRGY